MTFSLSGRPVRSVVPPLFRGDMSARQATVLESAYGNNTPPDPVKLGEEIGRLSSLSSLSLSLPQNRSPSRVGDASRLLGHGAMPFAVADGRTDGRAE